jgi:hypothetical protein
MCASAGELFYYMMQLAWAVYRQLAAMKVLPQIAAGTTVLRASRTHLPGHATSALGRLVACPATSLPVLVSADCSCYCAVRRRVRCQSQVPALKVCQASTASRQLIAVGTEGVEFH